MSSLTLYAWIAVIALTGSPACAEPNGAAAPSPEVLKLIRAVAGAETSRDVYPKRPKVPLAIAAAVGQELERDPEVRGGYSRLSTGTSVEKLDAIDALRNRAAVNCLATALCSEIDDLQIRSARALQSLPEAKKNIPVLRLLLTVSERFAVHEAGCENATLNGIFQHALAQTLNHLLGTDVRLQPDQDPTGLRAGIPTWEAALAARAEPGVRDELLMRRLFIEVEGARRLPPAGRSAAVPRLYREVYPKITARGFHVRVHLGKPPSMDLSVEQLADFLAAEEGAPSLWMRARGLLIELFQEERKTLLPLLKADLESTDEETLRRALHLVGVVGGAEEFEAVVRVFRNRPSLNDWTIQALRQLRDPRAIPVLLSADPKQPLYYFEALRTLQRDRAAHSGLLALLQASDPELRWRAAYALAESGDPKLAPLAETLAADPDARVREQAAAIRAALRRKDQ